MVQIEPVSLPSDILRCRFFSSPMCEHTLGYMKCTDICSLLFTEPPTSTTTAPSFPEHESPVTPLTQTTPEDYTIHRGGFQPSCKHHCISFEACKNPKHTRLRTDSASPRPKRFFCHSQGFASPRVLASTWSWSNFRQKVQTCTMARSSGRFQSRYPRWCSEESLRRTKTLKSGGHFRRYRCSIKRPDRHRFPNQRNGWCWWLCHWHQRWCG